MKTLLVALAAASLAAPVLADDLDTPALIERTLAKRNSHLIYVMPHGGQYFHRFSHLLMQGTDEMKPEAALGLGYSRCPECLPPKTTADLEAELSSGEPRHSKYYSYYLDERKNPLNGKAGGTLQPYNKPATGGPTLQLGVTPPAGAAPAGAPAGAPAAPPAPPASK